VVPVPPSSHRWPRTPEALREAQRALSAARPSPWRPGAAPSVAGVALASTRGAAGPGEAGERAVAAAVVLAADGAEIARAVHAGSLAAPFEPGLLALREGPLLEAAVRALPAVADVLLVHAAGRDHPRRAGLALMLGAALDLPTVGVTSRPLAARGEPPPDAAEATSPLALGGEVVAMWFRPRAGVRPAVVHAAWRTSAEVAVEIVRATARGLRTPEPVRRARALARAIRSGG
jgi:deoxyribonuclease V